MGVFDEAIEYIKNRDFDSVEDAVASYKGNITPRLVGVDTDGNEIVFDPPVVTRLGGTLPFERKQFNTQCGQTIQNSSGDSNVRFVFEAVAPLRELSKLGTMRFNPDQVRLQSAAHSGPVQFDQIKFDRIADANERVELESGQTVQSEEPLYEVNLQSKEQTTDDENNDLI